MNGRDFCFENYVRGRPEASIEDEDFKSVMKNDLKLIDREFLGNISLSTAIHSDQLETIWKENEKHI